MCVEAVRGGNGPDRSSRRRRTAGTGTTRATRSDTGPTTSSTSGSERDPLIVHARATRVGGRRRRRDRRRCEAVRRAASSTTRSRGAGRRAPARPSRRSADFVSSPSPGTRPSPRRAGRRCVQCSASWTRSDDHAPISGSPTNERVFVAGIDVGDGGNVFGLTRGLRETIRRWRARDTPISETAVMGVGVGAAMAGMRPVVELMYLDFLGVCLDQLLNQAAKLPFMTGGATQMALTVRTQFGAGRSSGSQHSQSLEAMLAHIPGLTVVMPSTPVRHLRATPRRDPRSEPGGVHREPVALRHEGPATAGRSHRADRQVSRRATRAPTSRSSRCRAWCTKQSPPRRRLDAEGISVEVIDLRTVTPLDIRADPRVGAQDESAPDRARSRGCRSASAPRSPQCVPQREGFWDLDAPHRTHRCRRRRRHPTRPTWNGRGSPTTTTSPPPSATSPPPEPSEIAGEGCAIRDVWQSIRDCTRRATG